MRWDQLGGEACPVARAMAVIGDRWTVLILRDCLRGVRRFDDFHERLGCSRVSLSRRLSHLVSSGVLETQEYQAHPPRQEYRLTEQGSALSGVLMLLAQWAETWRPLPDARPLRRVHKTCGHEFKPMVVCSECATEIAPNSVAYPEQGQTIS